MQRYEPIVLLHCAFTLQAGGEELHSLISEKKNKIEAQKKQTRAVKEWWIHCLENDSSMTISYHILERVLIISTFHFKYGKLKLIFISWIELKLLETI